ncbi:hypothetical protein CAEBREN_23304 [Caenorhabditis brenneri]|uniref:Uncharacterized protein n=1 Tax=Caenorhabditis brenneri TaxID=135651 RepID=G0MT23_CAEBE|nr:hypothetical protein CAEBREN_23304 [Caenorhabditis brenneri]
MVSATFVRHWFRDKDSERIYIKEQILSHQHASHFCFPAEFFVSSGISMVFPEGHPQGQGKQISGLRTSTLWVLDEV